MSPIRDHQMWGARCPFVGLPASGGACYGRESWSPDDWLALLAPFIKEAAA